MPGLLAELGNEVRIGQEAHVEDEVGVERHAVLEAEAQAAHQQALGLFLVAESLLDVRAQFMHVEVGGVDEGVGDVANRIEQLALFDDRAFDGLGSAQRMGPARLGVAPDEDGILGVEKDDARGQDLLDLFQNFGQTVERLAFANIDDDGCTFNLAGFARPSLRTR